MKHRLRMPLNLGKGNHWGGRGDYTLGLMGKSARRQFKITANSRHSDVSQAGSRSGCLPTGQRESDPDHTPECSAGQPLKWTMTYDRCTRKGNAFRKKKSTGLRRHPTKWRDYLGEKKGVSFAQGESPWQNWNSEWVNMRESLKFKTENTVKLSREVTVNKVRYKYFRVWTHIHMVSSRFFIEAPFYTNTHTLAFTNGHTIKVSVPGFFFHQVPWHWVVNWAAHFRWLTSDNKLTVLQLRRDTQSLFSTLNPCIKRWYE